MELDHARKIMREAIDQFNPTHIVSMVSGGRDSAASDAVARELGIPIDLVIHGNTRCGIKETTDWVRERYQSLGDYAEADAGSAYEDYVLRKGFFGKGITAHAFAYRILKAGPMRHTISKEIRQGKRDIRILMLNGARRDESENRKKNLQVFRRDPSSKNNIWCSLIYDWSAEDRDAYTDSREVPINPVAVNLCRSGECMCGTMQTDDEYNEAAILYPEFGKRMGALRAEAFRIHGFDWGQPFPKNRNQIEMFPDAFMPMCVGCGKGEK